MLTVVKLGGSLYDSAYLTAWLNALANHAETRPIIIVPGGGPFADTVRKAQQDHALSDETAHQMAINAMRQFALLMLDLQPVANAFSDTNTSPVNGLSIWLPDDAALLAAELPQNWQVSADTLALWLAQQLHAEQLVLVKSCDIVSPKISVLTEGGVLDTHFIKQYRQQSMPCSIAQHSDVADWSKQIMLQ